jgi:hypothetical protein
MDTPAFLIMAGDLAQWEDNTVSRINWTTSSVVEENESDCVEGTYWARIAPCARRDQAVLLSLLIVLF